MGQNVPALMYGIDKIEVDNLWDEDDSLMERWREEAKSRIGAESAYDDEVDVHVPESLYASDLPALGFFVARGGRAKGGVPRLEPCALEDIPTRYAASIKDATEKWEVFATWCADQGIALPPARLYYTITEIA